MEAASPINAPHPDDEEDFFGGGAEPSIEGPPSLSPEAAAEEARVYREEHGEPTEQAHSVTAGAGDDQQAKLRAIAERERAEAEAAAAEAAAATAEEPEPVDPSPPAASDGPTEAAAPRGSVDRTYIVFQKVPLTEKVLKHLLKQIEDGKAPEPRVAFFELQRPVARNDRTAVVETYRAHRESLGAECELAAVSERSFKERKVAPRQVVRDDISIV